jgi:hypothetical protein
MSSSRIVRSVLLSCFISGYATEHARKQYGSAEDTKAPERKYEVEHKMTPGGWKCYACDQEVFRVRIVVVIGRIYALLGLRQLGTVFMIFIFMRKYILLYHSHWF